MKFITRPIEKWPRPETKSRRNAQYRVSYERTLRDLDYELRKLGVKDDVVVMLDVLEREIRLDGLAYSNARPRSPRVGIAFDSRHGRLIYYCDAFTDWQDNVRAIALGLQRLRMVEDTGIVSRGEQYTGFKALPAGIELGPAAMTVEEAAGVLVTLAVGALATPTFQTARKVAASDKIYYSELYRSAAKRHHPDAGGDPARWQELQAASAVLDRHFTDKERTDER